MDFFDKLNKSKGGYIFLSHSHDDIEKVRKLRNMLEDEGFEPLCFYLKCLEDEEEIADLIKREIDAREWFVFVDSENSRKSRWVKLERDYITKTDQKKILSVCIDEDDAINDLVNRIKHNLRVFISYSHFDSALENTVREKLKEKDYLVFSDEDLCVGSDWVEEISNMIADASKDGCVIALITENSMRSEYVKKEIMFAVQEKGNVIPVLVGDVRMDDSLRYCLADKQMLRLSKEPTLQEIDKLVDDVGKLLLGKFE